MHRFRTVNILLLTLVLTGFGLLSACSSKNESTVTPKNLLHANWNDVLTQAKGQKVNFYMWGGSDSINRYVDDWVAPRLKKETDVELHRVPVSDIKDTINQLVTEKQVGKEKGNIDLVWINGENFKAAKDNHLLWGSFANELPNFNSYVNKDEPDTKYDFGVDTAGLEVPWGKTQYVFIYNSDKVKNPPKSVVELQSWIKEHPGKFTYPAPPDFTGSAFIRHVLFETTGGYSAYLKPFDQKAMEVKTSPLWNTLNNWKPFLWRKGETYPESLAKLDQLYANGEVWMTMGYDPGRASNEMKKGRFPESTRTLVWDKGTLANSHYLSIPFNASAQAGAMVAANFLLSPDAQIAKFDPNNWGDDMSLDPQKLSASDQQRLTKIDRGNATLPSKVLASHRIPEIAPEYVEYLEKSWLEHVAKH